MEKELGTGSAKGKTHGPAKCIKIVNKGAGDKRRDWLKGRAKDTWGRIPSRVELASQPPSKQKELLAGPALEALRRAGLKRIITKADRLLEEDNEILMKADVEPAFLLQTMKENIGEPGTNRRRFGGGRRRKPRSSGPRGS